MKLMFFSARNMRFALKIAVSVTNAHFFQNVSTTLHHTLPTLFLHFCEVEYLC
jgi:hypothetical protein